jgi:hypothetical protein
VPWQGKAYLYLSVKRQARRYPIGALVASSSLGKEPTGDVSCRQATNKTSRLLAPIVPSSRGVLV